MSAPINDGGPAFPSPALEGATDHRGQMRDGMTLRDWFAGQALAGINALPSSQTWTDWTPTGGPSLEHWRRNIADEEAVHCYRQADAMLKARQPEATK